MRNIEQIINLIDNEMDFYSYEDFYRNAEPLKRMYHAFCENDFRTKKLYHWYVYSREIKYGQKNRIWDYLNNDISLGELMEYEKSKKEMKKKM